MRELAPGPPSGVTPSGESGGPSGASESEMAAGAIGGGEPLRILLVFAGDGEAEHAIQYLLRQRGHTVVALDTKQGGWRHDVLRSEVGGWAVDAVEAGCFDCIFAAPPCSSYSVRHPVKLRSRASPEGVSPLPRGWEAYVAKHNKLAAFTARLIDAARAAEVPIAVENPADRGDDDSPAAWDEKADYGSLWLMECIATALARSSARTYTFGQCARARLPSGVLRCLGSRAQKWTTVAATSWLAPALAPLRDALCEHGEGGHAERLEGFDGAGVARATAAAAYPAGFSTIVADALETAGLRRRAHVAAMAACGPPTPPADEGTDGRASAGRSIGAATRAAIERGRRLEPSFASQRNSEPATPAELRREALGGNLHARVRSAAPRSACKAMRRRPVLRGSQRGRRRARCEEPRGCAVDTPPPPPAGHEPSPLLELWGELPDEIRARGAVHIEELYLPGVYESEVLSWLRMADAAATAIRRGEAPPSVPTRTIEAAQQPAWARGRVWDCSDPRACVPVQRSTRETVFEGEQQLDRAAVRRVALLIGWDDDDLISQIGEGGVETRADCELVTVLAFHHDSLLAEVAKAQEDVAKHVEKGWVAPPRRDLPFVPCRLQPRGVVMQARSRLASDGRLEEYLKPRITTDGSFGGPDSMNACVPDLERGVTLPSAQTFGRGWAICQSAFDGAAEADGGGTLVGGYCVDAESAYSFCPVQQADLWMQAFCWWGEDGAAGFAVDRRMGFGGAFAPNRFERVSTFVAAYAAHLHAELDAACPLPLCAQRWASDRARLQREGLLPEGEGQLAPRYIQSYIDDFTGAAATDRVELPARLGEFTSADLDAVVFADEHMVAAGCRPAPRDTRVHVHARLTVLALRTLGLVAAPHKIACGAPLPALGLRFDGERRIIDCPEGRRATTLAACEAALEMATRDHEPGADREQVQRLTGRLCSLTQVDHRLRRHLHAGYRLGRASWVAGGRRRTPRWLPLPAATVARDEWVALLQTAAACLRENPGAAMAPQRLFPSVHRPGSLIIVTDASGDDGVGGYALLADAPHEVFIVSDWWPADVRAALHASADEAQAALRRGGSREALPYLPMPAAELAGQLLVAELVAREAQQRGLRVRRVIAVGDCEPATRALDALRGSSTSPHMRSLVQRAELAPWRWLSVHVPREANVDADRLSHPQMAAAVLDEVAAAHLTPTRLGGAEGEVAEADWEATRRAIAAGVPAGERRRYKRRRRSAAAALDAAAP